MDQKHWYQSKTIWLNIIVIVLGAVSEVFKLFPNAAQAALVVTGLLNFALRYTTDSVIK